MRETINDAKKKINKDNENIKSPENKLKEDKKTQTIN